MSWKKDLGVATETLLLVLISKWRRKLKMGTGGNKGWISSGDAISTSGGEN